MSLTHLADVARSPDAEAIGELAIVVDTQFNDARPYFGTNECRQQIRESNPQDVAYVAQNNQPKALYAPEHY
jgi:hypothetical protein